MMEPAVEPFANLVRRAGPRPPQVPIVSTATGRLLTNEEATSPAYWSRHMRVPVRFTEALRTLWADPSRILLEVGPRGTGATLARQNRLGPDAPESRSRASRTAPNRSGPRSLKPSGRCGWRASQSTGKRSRPSGADASSRCRRTHSLATVTSSSRIPRRRRAPSPLPSYRRRRTGTRRPTTPRRRSRWPRSRSAARSMTSRLWPRGPCSGPREQARWPRSSPRSCDSWRRSSRPSARATTRRTHTLCLCPTRNDPPAGRPRGAGGSPAGVGGPRVAPGRPRRALGALFVPPQAWSGGPPSGARGPDAPAGRDVRRVRRRPARLVRAIAESRRGRPVPRLGHR